MATQSGSAMLVGTGSVGSSPAAMLPAFAAFLAAAHAFEFIAPIQAEQIRGLDPKHYIRALDLYAMPTGDLETLLAAMQVYGTPSEL